jgi:hypothetical protein
MSKEHAVTDCSSCKTAPRQSQRTAPTPLSGEGTCIATAAPPPPPSRYLHGTDLVHGGLLHDAHDGGGDACIQSRHVNRYII